MTIITSLHALEEPFRSAVRGILAEAMERRAYFVVTETVRDLARQEELFAQGKTRTLRSKHLEGKAVDVAAVSSYEGGKVAAVTWDREHRSWAVLGELALKWGVMWGGTWQSFPDYPHLEVRE